MIITWSTTKLTGAFNSGGKELTAVSSATRIRIPTIGEFTCGTPAPETEDRSRWPTWWRARWSLVALVSSLDHFGGTRTLGYQKKNQRRSPTISIQMAICPMSLTDNNQDLVILRLNGYATCRDLRNKTRHMRTR